MVVGAPDVDQVIEAAAELLGHVADVGREVGRPPVGAVDDAILVVAEGRRTEPQGAVPLEHMTVLPEALDRALDPALLVQSSFAGPHVEMDTEPLQAGLDPLADASRGPAPEHGGRVGSVGRRFSPEVVRHGGREIADVVPLVALLGHRLAALDRRHRCAEVVDLGPGVVEVVLARHVLAPGLQDPAQEIADERPTRVPDREWPGRVGRDELHVDLARAGRAHPSPGIGLIEDAVDRRRQGVGPQPDVHEAGLGDLDRFDGGVGARLRRVTNELGGQERGELERRALVRPCELHGQVAREVAVLRVGRALHLDRRSGGIVGQRRQGAGLDGGGPGALQRGADLAAQRSGDQGSVVLRVSWAAGCPNRTGAARRLEYQGSQDPCGARTHRFPTSLGGAG